MDDGKIYRKALYLMVKTMVSWSSATDPPSAQASSGILCGFGSSSIQRCLLTAVGQADRLNKVNEFLKMEVPFKSMGFSSDDTSLLGDSECFFFHGFGNVQSRHVALAFAARRRSISRSARSSLCGPVRRASWPPWLVSCGQPWLT